MNRPALVDQCKGCGLTIEWVHGKGPAETPWCVRGSLCSDKNRCPQKGGIATVVIKD